MNHQLAACCWAGFLTWTSSVSAFFSGGSRGMILGLLILYMTKRARKRRAVPMIAMSAKSNQKGIYIVEILPGSDSWRP